jgi:1-acyl-sn-glycerol-3-phosphate acyltransferase
VKGLENLPAHPDGTPAGGWICCGLPHRNWVEPVLITCLLPAEPRPVILADGRTAGGSWWRRLLIRIIGGGVIAVRGRGAASDFTLYTESVRDAIHTGAVFLIFPEVGPPSRPPALRRVSPGVAHFARATGALTVTVVFGGTEELYLRRRIEVRVLPPISPPSRDADRDALAVWLAELRAQAEAVASEAHSVAESAPPQRKTWRWLTGPYPRSD